MRALRRDRARARDPAQADRAPATRSPPRAFNPQGRAVPQMLDEAEGKIFEIGEEGSRQRAGLPGHRQAGASQLIDRVNELHDNGAEEVHRRAHRLLRPRPHDRRPADGRPDRARRRGRRWARPRSR
ncbi:MAG: hypothetical protein MZV65_14545 [Chromatiales bacterium]|nr:hypothetical protein [Chromatiales bacterium]